MVPAGSRSLSDAGGCSFRETVVHQPPTSGSAAESKCPLAVSLLQCRTILRPRPGGTRTGPSRTTIKRRRTSAMSRAAARGSIARPIESSSNARSTATTAGSCPQRRAKVPPDESLGRVVERLSDELGWSRCRRSCASISNPTSKCARITIPRAILLSIGVTTYCMSSLAPLRSVWSSGKFSVNLIHRSPSWWNRDSGQRQEFSSRRLRCSSRRTQFSST